MKTKLLTTIESARIHLKSDLDKKFWCIVLCSPKTLFTVKLTKKPYEVNI